MAKPDEMAAPVCRKCKARGCAWYGAVGGYSVQCKECNEAASEKRRNAALRRKSVAPPDSSFSELIENAGVLERAAKIVDGRDKQQHYGPPEESMSRIAQVWSGILGITISAGQVALMMAGLKLARLGADPEHADSLDDLAGYAKIYERVK